MADMPCALCGCPGLDLETYLRYFGHKQELDDGRVPTIVALCDTCATLVAEAFDGLQQLHYGDSPWGHHTVRRLRDALNKCLGESNA